MNRRRFLGGASAGAALALAGCPATRDESSSDDVRPSEDTYVSDEGPVSRADFDREVNARDAGADSGGETPIDDLLSDHARSDRDELLVFPEGRYRLGSLSLEDAGRFGMVAADGATPTLVPDGPTDELGPALLQVIDAEAFVLDGFALDFRRQGYGGKLHVTTSGNLAVRNVGVRGRYPADASGFHLAVESEDATGLVENVSAPGGGPKGGKSIGAFVDRRHAGELTFRNCFFQNFPNNGLYASAPGGDGSLRGFGGVVRVLGGLYRNNNIANVRLGGRGAVARGVTIVVDEVPPYNELNARGLLFRNGGDHRVENCRIVLGEDAGDSLGAVVFNPDAGRVSIRDSNVELDRDEVPAVYAPRPSGKAPAETGPVFENVSIRGTAGGGRTVDVTGRDRTQLRNCRVVQSGDNRAGVRFARSDRCLLARTTIDVTGTPILNSRSSVNRRDVNVVGA
ncbi:hypothetical protein [Halorussus salinisoli]|uniref:hypothetical protein n=1 Tax=Halorussus salinisoli TaxID=2558242 RepID=UPI0014854A07|nr:hypothetical protein [Halorussus salinisoli]